LRISRCTRPSQFFLDRPISLSMPASG
jgi:hypothetical protein